MPQRSLSGDRCAAQKRTTKWQFELPVIDIVMVIADGRFVLLCYSVQRLLLAHGASESGRLRATSALNAAQIISAPATCICACPKIIVFYAKQGCLPPLAVNETIRQSQKLYTHYGSLDKAGLHRLCLRCLPPNGLLRPTEPRLNDILSGHRRIRPYYGHGDQAVQDERAKCNDMHLDVGLNLEGTYRVGQ